MKSIKWDLKRIVGNREVLVWFLLALLIRLAFLPFTTHVDPEFVSDSIAYNFHTLQMAQPGWTPILYPPMMFYTTAAFLFPMLNISLLPSFPMGDIPGDVMTWFSSPYIFRTLTFIRGWYIGFDFLGAIFLSLIFRHNVKKARRALSFWLFSPIIIYGAYFHGQLDLIPILFVAISLYQAKQGKNRWAAFWMGIGACFKNYPFLFLIPLVIILGKSWRERLVLLLIGVIPYILLLFPYLGSYSPSVDIIFDRFFSAGYDLGFGSRIYLFVAFYAVLLWYLYFRKANTFGDLWRSCFVVLLVYYQFGYFDLHYWIWVIPFATLYWVEEPKPSKPFFFVIIFFLIVLTAPNPLARFFAPISPNVFLGLPSLLEILNSYLPMLFIINVARSLLAGTCFYLAWKVMHNMPSSKDSRMLRREENGFQS